MSALVIRIFPLPAATLVTIAGDVDIATVPQLRAQLLAVPNRLTVLDMSKVGLLSAAGLRVLLDLQDRLARTGARVVLADSPSCVRRVLAITRLDTELVMVSAVDEAFERAGSEPTWPVGRPVPLRATSTRCRSTRQRSRSPR